MRAGHKAGGAYNNGSAGLRFDLLTFGGSIERETRGEGEREGLERSGLIRARGRRPEERERGRADVSDRMVRRHYGARSTSLRFAFTYRCSTRGRRGCDSVFEFGGSISLIFGGEESPARPRYTNNSLNVDVVLCHGRSAAILIPTGSGWMISHHFHFHTNVSRDST